MSTIYDKDWEDVTIRTIYFDRGKVQTRDVHLNRLEIEAEERLLLTEQAKENPDITPEIIDSFELPAAVFKQRVIHAARELSNTSLHLPPEDESNVLRILPPSAYREVQITINNLAQAIIA